MVAGLSATGDVEWHIRFGGNATAVEFANQIIELDSHKVLILGNATGDTDIVQNSHGSSEAVLLQLNRVTGQIEWVKSIGGSAQDLTGSLIKTADSGLLLGGSSGSLDGDGCQSQPGNYAFWVVKLNTSSTVGNSLPNMDVPKVFPTVSTGKVSVEYSKEAKIFVTDMLGRLRQIPVSHSPPLYTLDFSQENPGIYFIKITTKTENFTYKIVHQP